MSEPGMIKNFIKQVFYKTCFLVGLGTISYYSYGQVQSWTRNAPVDQSSPIQSKLDALMEHPENTGTLFSDNGLPTKLHYAKPKKPVAVTAMVEAPKADSLTTTVASAATAAPAPSASPGAADAAAATEKKEGEGEKKEGEEGKETPAVAQTGPVNAVGQPYALPPPSASDTPSAPAVDPNAAQGSSMLGMGANGKEGDEGTSGSSVIGAYNESVPSGSSSAVKLSAADITTLSGGLQGLFTDKTITVAGKTCTYGNLSDCVLNNSNTIYTGRWNVTYGLSSNASFSITPGTSGAVKVNVGFNYVDSNSNASTVTSSVVPSAVSITTESKNGANYKVYTLHLPNLSMLSGESLTNVTATLVYQLNSNGTTGAISTADSSLAFTRNQVETLGSDWTASNRTPAATDQVIVATSVPYSMTIEKSQ